MNRISWSNRSDFILAATYGVLLIAGLSVWFLAIRAPLWTDETVSYWQIAAGFKQTWARSLEGNYFPAYFYILWLTKAVFSAKELVLRIPSLLAMIAALYVFYRCARELFDWDVSLIATIVFVLPRWVAFAAIDVRPYAFALLVTNIAIFAFLRWTSTEHTKWAVMVGIASGSVLYFHYLFATIVAGFAVYYLLTQRSWQTRRLRQTGIAVICFAVVIVPVLPGLTYDFHTRTSHSFTEAPQFAPILLMMRGPRGQLLAAGGVLLLVAIVRRVVVQNRELLNKGLLCASLALVPVLTLYLISIASLAHVFIPRYLLVAMPGIALCLGWLWGLLHSRSLRATLCLAFALVCVVHSYRSPRMHRHEFSWKQSLAFADSNAAADHAPVAVCSPIIESYFLPMPAVPSESMLFAPLSYYEVNATVVPFPIYLNPEAEREGMRLVSQSAQRHGRFLVLGFARSRAIFEMLAEYSHRTHSYRLLGNFDEVVVVEFNPLPNAR